jgi:hypothetical protein
VRRVGVWIAEEGGVAQGCGEAPARLVRPKMAGHSCFS